MLARDRFGIDVKQRPLEEALTWAAEHGFRYVEFPADRGANALERWDQARVEAVRSRSQRLGLKLGLHPSSAVNIAETSPLVRDAVDAYLRAQIDLAARLGCGWIIAHGGYHFSNDLVERRDASLARWRRANDWAAAAGVELWLENHNREPDDAEIHYLPHTVAECRWFFDAFPASALRWSFNAAHANLVPEGIVGFLAAFGAERLAQVRLADNRGRKEEHLVPGAGTLDFGDLFSRLERLGFEGPLMLEFGSEEEKLQTREAFIRSAR